MSVQKIIETRAHGHCELCQAAATKLYWAHKENNSSADYGLMACDTCLAQIDENAPMDASHWTFLDGCMWSEIPAVQVTSWRMLHRLKNHTWAADLLDMMYLDEETTNWAEQTNDHLDLGEKEFHTDCNGTILTHGDTVTLIKYLDVKGSSITAKMGTPVRNIRLVPNNPGQLEGKVDQQQIVILTQYVRKQS